MYKYILGAFSGLMENNSESLAEHFHAAQPLELLFAGGWV